MDAGSVGRAFEVLDCERVELKTNVRNVRSRAAIEALGAQFEGVCRWSVIQRPRRAGCAR